MGYMFRYQHAFHQVNEWAKSGLLGDIVSVPFNVACGRCRTCRAGDTGVCLTVNPGLPGGAGITLDAGAVPMSVSSRFAEPAPNPG